MTGISLHEQPSVSQLGWGLDPDLAISKVKFWCKSEFIVPSMAVSCPGPEAAIDQNHDTPQPSLLMPQLLGSGLDSDFTIPTHNFSSLNQFCYLFVCFLVIVVASSNFRQWSLLPWYSPIIFLDAMLNSLFTQYLQSLQAPKQQSSKHTNLFTVGMGFCRLLVPGAFWNFAVVFCKPEICRDVWDILQFVRPWA